MTPENTQKWRILQQELKTAEARVANLKRQIDSLLDDEQELQHRLSPKENLETTYIPPIAGTSFKLVLEYLGLKDVQRCAQACIQWTNEVDHIVLRQAVANMIHKLAYSEDEEETEDVLWDLSGCTNVHESTKKKSEEYSKLIFELHGVGAIIGAAGRYKDNVFIQHTSFTILALLACHVDEASLMMAKIGVPKLAMESASRQYNKREFDEHVNSAVAGLMENMSCSKEEITRSDSFITFMVETMIRFPDDQNVQDGCCQYFLNISILFPKVQGQLREKKIGSLVAKAFEKFQSDDDVGTFGEAMKKFSDYM